MCAKSRTTAFIGALILVSAVQRNSTVFAAETDPPPQRAVAEAPGTLHLLYMQDGGQVYVTRAESELPQIAADGQSPRQREVESLARLIAAGPTAAEQYERIRNAIPEEATLTRVDVPRDSEVILNFDFPSGILGTPEFDWGRLQNIADQFVKPMSQRGVHNFSFRGRDSQTAEYKPLRDYIPKEKPDPPPTTSTVPTDGTPPSPVTQTVVTPKVVSNAPPSGTPFGALAGKAIVLNAAHGWFDNGGWVVQRSRTFEQIEDFSPVEFMGQFVVPALLNAGARVQPVRELDNQTNIAVVDNLDGSPGYVETGMWSSAGSSRGFTKASSWSGTGTTSASDPFAAAVGNFRYASIVSSGAADATATFTPNIPVTGYYNVYICYTSSVPGGNRATAAHFQVIHSGGTTDFRINQQRDGATWVLLGNFYFEAGQNSAKAAVIGLNDSSVDSGKIITVDAVRFGGGMGNVQRRTTANSKPRWAEEAVNYLQYTGMMGSSYMSGDSVGTLNDMQLGWGDRPQYARWEQERDSEGNDTIYVGWHTNATGDALCNASNQDNSGSGRGTNSYRDKDGDALPGTIALTSDCHAAMINGIRSFYDSGWVDDGIQATDGYGESNQDSGAGNLGTVSGFFFEALFGNNATDSGEYKDPKFRFVCARAIVQGIITYSGGTTFPPEAPTNFRIRNIGNGQARLDWIAGPVRGALPYGSPATEYRIYRSSNGYGFDPGTDTGNTNTNYTIALTPGQTTYFRIAAKNSAGVSFPSTLR